MIPLSTTGPYTARASGSGTWAILDAFGALVVIVVGEMAHHDAPIIAARLSGDPAKIQALEDKIEDLESEIKDLES